MNENGMSSSRFINDTCRCLGQKAKKTVSCQLSRCLTPCRTFHRTAHCQTTERNNAKLPNETSPNYRTELHCQQKFGLVEVKLGGETLVNEGAKTLNALARNIDTTKMKAPAFKMVLTAVGDVVYRRKEDGIVVCPISALRP